MPYSRNRLRLARAVGALVASGVLALLIAGAAHADPLGCERAIAKHSAKLGQLAAKALQKCRDRVLTGRIGGPCPDATAMTKLDRAERWFERWEDWAVFLGRLTPVIRSFVSIPAGVMEVPFVRYTLLTLAGSAIWCFGFAGIGFALGASWEDFQNASRYVDYLVVAAVVAAVAWLVWRQVRSRRRRVAEDSSDV